MYTLGLVLAELLSGERLCPGTSQIEVMLKHDEAAEFELPRAVSTSFLAPIVERAVRKAVADRFPSAAAMRTELEAVVTVLGPPTTTSGTILLPEHLRSAATPGSTVDLTDDSEPS